MKIVGLIILGLIASAVLYLPVFMLVAMVFRLGEILLGVPDSNANEGIVFLVTLFVVVPIAFLLGSIVTGYFSYYDIEDKWSFLWMAPALYLNLLWICVAGVAFLLDAFIGVNAPGPGFLRGLWVPVVLGLLWYIASAGGVFLGYYLRERFAKWWYGD